MLHGSALGLPERSEGPCDAADHAVSIVEGVARRQRIVAFACGGIGQRSHRGMLALELERADFSMHELLEGLPVGERGLEQRSVAQQDADAVLVRAHHPVDHVGLQDLAQALRAQGAVRGLVLLVVDALQDGALGLEDELLQRRHHEGRVTQGKAVLKLVLRLENGLDEGRHLLAQDVRVSPVGAVHRPGRLEASDVQGGLTVEVPMHQVAQGTALHAACSRLRECVPHGQESLLDGCEMLLVHLPAAAERLAHGIAQRALERGGVGEARGPKSGTALARGWDAQRRQGEDDQEQGI
mmetsp:Transcript_172699/g.553514  ORF Transcript_172699/g.553514 Transcript_172699/m.553514 type:complete len:297 (+) Transcript_172699:899-1789(+)